MKPDQKIRKIIGHQHQALLDLAKGELEPEQLLKMDNLAKVMIVARIADQIIKPALTYEMEVQIAMERVRAKHLTSIQNHTKEYFFAMWKNIEREQMQELSPVIAEIKKHQNIIIKTLKN